MHPALDVSVATVERWLHALYIGVEHAALRDEDRRKAPEVAAILEEVARVDARVADRKPLVLVDAAAGKAYVGLLAAKLVMEPRGRAGAIVTLEREPRHVASSRDAVARLQSVVPVECRAADLEDASAWPERPTLVVALHACGPASDIVIERAIASEAASLLLVPCCTSRAVRHADWAAAEAERHGIPRQAPVRRRYLQALVDAARTLRLEAAGYETEVVEFVAATITPHNLLWRSRLVREPVRMARAAAQLATLCLAG
jgi:hypothetical protein